MTHRPASLAETEILAGPHAVAEALRAGRRSVRRVWLARQERGGIGEIIQGLARDRRIPVEVRPRVDLDRLVKGATHQGVLAEVGPFPYATAEDVVARALSRPGAGFLLVLDGIQDPQNLGAIVRSAEAAGVDGILLPKDRAAGMSPGAVRASAGAAEHLLVARITNVAAFLDHVRSQGFWVVGTDAAAGRDLFASDLTSPLTLVVGGEDRGLRPLTKSRCDLIVRIPLGGRVSSLNASAAAAVCLFEVARQRGARARQGSDRGSRC